MNSQLKILHVKLTKITVLLILSVQYDSLCELSFKRSVSQHKDQPKSGTICLMSTGTPGAGCLKNVLQSL